MTTLRTVLVVEHDMVLNMFMVDLVEAAGFAALHVRTADEALGILETRPDTALLITNVAMRGSLSGVELAHVVDERWPSVKIIVVSGKNGLAESDLPAKSLLFAKPYRDEDLIFEIRALLDEAPGLTEPKKRALLHIRNSGSTLN